MSTYTAFDLSQNYMLLTLKYLEKQNMVVKCPCCKKVVKGISFKCVTCPKRDTWVHPRCGGYSNEEVTSTPSHEQHNLKCNNCKKVIVLIFGILLVLCFLRFWTGPGGTTTVGQLVS